ncbi:MAG: class I adenylate cyclase [Desulfobacterales bacterium]|nr:class I adenylate cyclase [Desulfobacterales bacterium]
MLRTLEINRKKFIQYNSFRKKLFSEAAPEDSKYILYLLPWLLSVNHPNCPGYVPKIDKHFRVFNVDQESEIREMEENFKRRFGIETVGSLMVPYKQYCLIHGLYTIGSVGTIGQTTYSDCDIWLCYDKQELNVINWEQLNQKINLIKGWLDNQMNIPVFFFCSDITDIKQGQFGNVDSESSGSLQTNVLKEEFYRTCMVICGKIPLWWICYDKDMPINYNDAVQFVQRQKYGYYDCVDMGNIENVYANEYFGAALWQLQKSLTRPLKSIIKMVLLQMQLDAPSNQLICHDFRRYVFMSDINLNDIERLYLKNEKQNAQDNNLSQDRDIIEQFILLDPMIFTISSIYKYYHQKRNKQTLRFINECFYLRCEIKAHDTKTTIRRILHREFLKRYPISIERRTQLNTFSKWSLYDQIQFGYQLIQFLLQIYKEICTEHAGTATQIDKQDLTILGRKIAASFQKKENKIVMLPKPSDKINLDSLVFKLKDNQWHLYTSDTKKLITDSIKPLASHPNIIYLIAFILWNQLYIPGHISMEPNSSSVTIREIINLINKMHDFFGTTDIFSIPYPNYLKKERIRKLLTVISFEKNPWEKEENHFNIMDINDLSIVSQNTWGELFVRRFESIHQFNFFLKECTDQQKDYEIEKTFYLQRNPTYYSKIIQQIRQRFL